MCPSQMKTKAELHANIAKFAEILMVTSFVLSNDTFTDSDSDDIFNDLEFQDDLDPFVTDMNVCAEIHV